MKRIIGYAVPLSVAPGETVELKISVEPACSYRAEIHRVTAADNTEGGPGFLTERLPSAIDGEHEGRVQRLHPGSCVVVQPCAALDGISSFTVATIVWPTLPGHGAQAIIGRWSEPEQRGFGLFLDESGALELRLGARNHLRLSTERPLPARRWYKVAASFNAATGMACLYQWAIEPLPGEPPLFLQEERVVGAAHDAGGIPLLMAAATAVGRATTAHLDGKIERPRLASRALDAAEIVALLNSNPPAALRPDLVGAWDFSREIPSERAVDIGPNGLHGTLRQMPTRAVTGHLWRGQAEAWREAPELYGAIHFHRDDMIDAEFHTDLTWQVPEGTRSGCYMAVLTAEDGSVDHIPFYIRPARGQASSKLAFLVPTATYMAYGNFMCWAGLARIEPLAGGLFVADEHDLHLLEHPECGWSTYDLHLDGSGIHYGSRLRPLLTLRPNRPTMWNLNADSHITAWLEAIGQDYDVITDEDLHAEGLDLLRHYRCVITGTHPEYYSEPMLDGVEAFLGRGGRLIYMGGNGFYWRIAFHEQHRGVMEIRRRYGTSNWMSPPGEASLAFDGAPGGVWRHLGRAPNQLVGIGFAAEGFDRSSAYRRSGASLDPRAAFIFEGVPLDGLVGDFGSVGGGAAGLELDRADPLLGTPPHALVLASSTPSTPNYLLVLEDMSLNHQSVTGPDNPDVRADLVFMETSGGGAVLSTGSIAWAGSLAHNGYQNNVAQITGNTLKRFLDETPFPPPQMG